MVLNSKQQRRNLRQQQLNTALSTLPTFSSLNPYHVYHIHRFTSTNLLHDLIRLARTTSKFSIDTEKDFYTHKPALIQIELIQDRQSTVLLIEVCHLPHVSSIVHWLIRALLKIIFNSNNLIYAWGNIVDELTDFIPCGLFNMDNLCRINSIDIQHEFKQRHDRHFNMEFNIPSMKDNNSRSLIAKYSMKSYEDDYHQWSLQMAIAFTFHEFHDKSLRNSRWSDHLDPSNVAVFTMLHPNQYRIRQRMVHYAVNDCLTVTKLATMLNFL